MVMVMMVVVGMAVAAPVGMFVDVGFLLMTGMLMIMAGAQFMAVRLSVVVVVVMLMTAIVCFFLHLFLLSALLQALHSHEYRIPENFFNRSGYQKF